MEKMSIFQRIKRWLWPKHPKTEEQDRCPRCKLRFNEWFFWPGKGDYCWPCYHTTGRIYVRKIVND